MNLTHSNLERKRITKRALESSSEPLELLKIFGITNNMNGLEIGSGSGVHLIAIANWLQNGSIVGIEKDRNFLVEAKKLLKHSKLTNAKIRAGDAQKLRFKDDYFDFVYARLVFQHIFSPTNALNEIKRVLKPGGKCIIEDIDRGFFASWPETIDLKKAWQLINEAQIKSNGDPFIGRKLEYLLKKSGFKEVKVDIESHQGDGIIINDFSDGVAESLLDYLPEKDKTTTRQIIQKWAEAAKNEPEMYSLYMNWFIASGIA